ncbi:cystin-1 isoform X2 [Rhineura floridana]|uniref:cystin-1 isoform X2 n=1 Tax=Rhineura floridana TaxID=261503 RepID=UPI002AC84795|nr:cystin-1 isoform X2 [Rhineura floridana]
MGTGSSRAGKARSPARHWRGPGRGSGSSSAPARQGHAEEEAEAAARCCSQTPTHTTSPSLGESDSDSELLDQVLEECDDEGLLQLPRRRPLCLDAGDFCSRPAGGSVVDGGIHRDQQVFLARSAPGLESNNFANQLPLKPERQAKISYDYSEEELMATIEQEYCR